MRIFISLFLLLTSLPALAGEYTFTTVFYDDGGIVYVGLKHGEGAKTESQVISFPFPPMGTRTKIPLPDEVAHRDVIGLIPDRQKLFVLTNSTEDKEAGPMLHLFDQKRNEWKKIGKVNCPTFTKVKLTSTRMTFYCEVANTNKRTRKRHPTHVVAKALPFGKERIYRSGTWRFPEFLLRYKSMNLLLEGDAPNWDKLRLKSPEEERLIKAEDLFDLPDPHPATMPAPDSASTS
jgi:hypothetical protein